MTLLIDHGTGVIRCERCGAEEVFKPQRTVEELAALIAVMERQHQECEEKPSDD